MKIHQLNCLVAIAESGSIRTAAIRLGRSATAISKTLRELEREVGSILLERTRDGVLLNEAGKKLAEHARLIMRSVQTARDELAVIQHGMIGGHVAIVSTPWLVAPLIGPALRRLNVKRPDVQISITEHLGDRYPTLRDGRADLAFGPTPANDEAQYFDITPLFSHECAVLARNGHPAEHATTWAELAPYDWIATNEFLGVPAALSDAINRDIKSGVQRVHRAGSTFSLLSMLRSTDMLAIVPWPVVEIPGVRMTFTALQINHPGTTEMCLITRKDDVLSTASTDFLECFDAVRAEFGTTDDPIAKRIAVLVDPIEIDV
jgi:LysR family transcriptional regulator, regulator of abg operon